jgi:hypothetical protein
MMTELAKILGQLLSGSKTGQEPMKQCQAQHR